MTEVNKKPLTYLYLHQFNLEMNYNSKNAISKSHLSNASDKFFKRMWLPQLIYSHIQRCFEKKPFSRFVVSLERLRERPWVTEKPWKTLRHRKFVKKLKNLSKVRWTEKNNSKQTNCMIGKYFLALSTKWFVLGINGSHHITHPIYLYFI